MQNLSLTVLAAFLVIAQVGPSLAQDTDSAALAEAKARLACGVEAVVSARYIANGGLEVTCARGRGEEALAATGLGASGAVGALLGLVVLGALGGGGGGGTTTTTSTTTSSTTTSSTTSSSTASGR